MRAAGSAATRLLARLAWPLVVVASALALLALVQRQIDTPLRLPLTLWFVCVCPGMAFVPLLRIRAPVVELTLGVALSLALSTAVPTAMVYLLAWSPADGLAILAALTLAGALLQVAQALWERRAQRRGQG